MTPFVQCEPDLSEEKIAKLIGGMVESFRKDPSIGRALFGGRTPTEKEFEESCQRTLDDEVKGSLIFKNDVYQVNIRKFMTQAAGWPAMIHLSIKRLDKMAIHDWRDMQEIKNELVGPEYEAVELYPAESRLVDSANQYHLWVLTEGRFPFGFNGRFIINESSGGATQRPRQQ